MSMPHIPRLTSRRQFLSRAGGGFGTLALSYLLSRDGFPGRAAAADPASGQNAGRAADLLAPRSPHHPASAKSVIWLFMEGGPSHLGLFDPKPELERLAGKPMPESFGRPITAMGTATNTLMPSRRSWKRHGKSGIWVSDWYPNIAKHVDSMTVFQSC